MSSKKNEDQTEKRSLAGRSFRRRGGGLFLAWQLGEAFASSRQVRLFRDENGEAVLDAETQCAALTFEMVRLQAKPRVARTQGAAKYV